MADIRDALLDDVADATTGESAFFCDWYKARLAAEAVLDSIPPGSYKLDDKTWVRLGAMWWHYSAAIVGAHAAGRGLGVDQARLHGGRPCRVTE